MDHHPAIVSSERVERQERGDPCSSEISEGQLLTKPTKIPKPKKMWAWSCLWRRAPFSNACGARKTLAECLRMLARKFFKRLPVDENFRASQIQAVMRKRKDQSRVTLPQVYNHPVLVWNQKLCHSFVRDVNSRGMLSATLSPLEPVGMSFEHISSDGLRLPPSSPCACVNNGRRDARGTEIGSTECHLAMLDSTLHGFLLVIVFAQRCNEEEACLAPSAC